MPLLYRPRRFSYTEKQAVHEIKDNLLDERIIRKRESEYSSPTVLIKTKM